MTRACSGILAAPTVRQVAGASLLVALGVCLVTGWGAVPVWAVPALALVVAGSELATVHLQFGRQRWGLSFMEGALGAALVLATGAWTVVAVGLGMAVAQMVRRQVWLKREFSLAQAVCATALGQAVAGALEGGIVGASVGLLVYWTVNYGLIALAVSVTEDRSLRMLAPASVPMSAVYAVGNSSIGLLAAFLATTAPLGLIGLVVPFALLWWSYDQQTRRSVESHLFADLARGQEGKSHRSSDRSAEVIVTAAGRTLVGADIELVVLAADGPVRYSGDHSGTPIRRRLALDAFDAPWVLRTLGEPGATCGREGLRPYLCAVLGDPDAPLALLRAQRDDGEPGFTRNELRLARVLVGQAQAWLMEGGWTTRTWAAGSWPGISGGGAKPVSEMGLVAAPALVVIGESAERLARLAESAGRVEEIVEELQVVQRAVAALLGSISLAVEPERLQFPGQAVPARQGTDWTTTGVLR